jgi:hypothetical protein
MSTRGGEWWLGGVNSRALQQRDGQVGVVGERWFWRSRTPGTYTVLYMRAGGGTSSNGARAPGSAQSLANAASDLKRDGAARLPTALLGYGRLSRPTLRATRATEGGRMSRCQEEQQED